MLAKYLFSAFIYDDQSVMLLRNWQLETKRPNWCQGKNLNKSLNADALTESVSECADQVRVKVGSSPAQSKDAALFCLACRGVPGGVSLQCRVSSGTAERPLLLWSHRVRRRLQASVWQGWPHIHQWLHATQGRVSEQEPHLHQAPRALWWVELFGLHRAESQPRSVSFSLHF